MKENIIQTKTFQFSLKIIDLYKALKDFNHFQLASQLIRSGTGIGANVEEAIAAISKKEFISKMAIASKEARETFYWLRLLEASHLIAFDYTDLKTDSQEIIRILSAIVKSSQENSQEL